VNRLNLKLGSRLIPLLAIVLCACAASAEPQGATTEYIGGRDAILFVPPQLPAKGTRSLVIVLHGGLGNAQRIESGQSEHGLNMDSVAARAGFIVAYLNGTPATRRLSANMLAWNAGGGCCGQPSEQNIDDVRYIQTVVSHLENEYNIDSSHVYGIGHSNGAMMTQRVMCETGLYAAAISISGPLNLVSATCGAARGKKVLAIHGADDANVPIAGGRGTKGVSGAVFNSEERTRQTYAKAGVTYDLQILTGADHNLGRIEQVIQQTEGRSIAEKAAEFFGLLNQSH
jgi:polyhydroxybutyrate depolymerase